MAADISAPGAAFTNAACSVGFATIDAEPATGSIATDSATTIAVMVLSKRIFVPLDACNIAIGGLASSMTLPLGDGIDIADPESPAYWPKDASISLMSLIEIN